MDHDNKDASALHAHLAQLYARESALTTGAITLAVGAVALGGFIFTLRGCEPTGGLFAPPTLESLSAGETLVSCLPLIVYQFIPLLPFTLLTMFLYLVAQANVLGSYSRHVERTIVEMDRPPTRAANLVPVPSLARLNHYLFAGGPGLGILRAVFLIFSVATTLVLLGQAIGKAFFLLAELDPWLESGLLEATFWWNYCLPLVYISALFLSLLGIQAVRGRARLFYRLAEVFAESEEDAARTHDLGASGSSSWRLASYLLLPKGASLTKALWGVGGALAFVVLRAADSSNQPRDVVNLPNLLNAFILGAAVAIVIELVLIQGRYVLNDLRDLEFDTRVGLTHQRIPQPITRGRLALVLGSVVVRIALYIAVVALLSDIARASATALLLVLVTIPYEYIRDRSRSRFSSRLTETTAEVSGGGREGSPNGETGRLLSEAVDLRPYWTLLWVVGLGYGARFVVPAAVLADLSLPLLALLAVAFVAVSLGGSAVTWAGWVKEVTQFVKRGDRASDAQSGARTQSNGRGDKASEPLRASPALAGKGHLAWVGVQANILSTRTRLTDPFSAKESLFETSPWRSVGNHRLSLMRWVPVVSLALLTLVQTAIRLGGYGNHAFTVYLLVATLTVGLLTMGAFGGTRFEDLERRKLLGKLAGDLKKKLADGGKAAAVAIVGPAFVVYWQQRSPTLGRSAMHDEVSRISPPGQ